MQEQRNPLHRCLRGVGHVFNVTVREPRAPVTAQSKADPTPVLPLQGGGSPKGGRGLQKQVAPRDAPSSCKWTGGVFYSWSDELANRMKLASYVQAHRRCNMLDLNLIRETPDLVRTALKNRQMDASPVDEILQARRKAPGSAHTSGSPESRTECRFQGDRQIEGCGGT